MSQMILPYDKEFFDEYGVYIKPVNYPLSSKKIDSLRQIARMQKYFQCNPVKFIDIMFNIELLDFQALLVERSWFTKNVLAVCSRGKLCASPHRNMWAIKGKNRGRLSSLAIC